MIPHLRFWCSLLFIINFCDSVFSLIKKQYEIHDLVSTDATTFAADASAWEVEGNLTATLYTTCGSTLLLGGDGVLEKFAFFKRTYTELETHNGISGQIAFWLIDNWRTNDDLIMLRIFDEVSTNIYYQRVLTVAYSASWGSSVCGSSSYGDLQTAKLNFRFPHSGPNITFQIYTTHPMDANPVSYGIRDVRIMLHKDAPSLSVCTLPGSIFMSDRCTSCANNQYNLGLGCASCGTYDDACVNNANNPYVCKSSATLYAQDPTHCSCAPCDSSCLTCSVANSAVGCLTCQSGLYLFSNGTCLPSCPFTITPLNGINYCDFTCLSLTATEYLYPNYTCLTSCDPPYAIIDVVIGKLCNFPCAPSGFAYPNNQCRSSCPLPMRTYIEPLNIQYCRVPCDNNLYYYPEDGSCRATCPYPHAIKQNEFYYECDVGSASAVAFAALTSSMNGDAAEVVNKGTLAASFIFVGQSWGIFVAAYTRLFQNIRYVNASYATHTELLVKNWNNSLMTLEFFPSMPQSLQKKVPENPTVAMFELYGVQSSFIVSCWRAFMSIMSVLTVFILLWFIEWMTLRTGSRNAVLKFLRILAQNSFLITLYGNFGYIVMYAILEYRSLNVHNTNGLSILSFILAITFLLAVFVSLILSFLFLRKRGKLIQKAEWTENYGPLKAFTKENTGFQVLFIDFKEKYQSFLFTFMLRDIVCNLVVGVLTNFPLMQAGVLSVCNIMWFFYLYSNRPFRRILDQIQFTFYEVLLLFANGSALVATVLDDVEDVDDSLREILAKIIMFTTMIYSYSVFVFFGLKGANMIYDIYKIRKALKNPLVDKEELAQEQGFLGDMLGLDGENLNQDITNQDKGSSFIANDSKLESNSLIKSEKSRPLRSKKPAPEASAGIIDEYYRKKELVMDSNNLRVHVGRFGKGKGEKDLDSRIQRRPRKGSFEDFKGDGRKKLTDLVPKPDKAEKPSYKMPETELRCREKQDLDEKIRKEQTSNNLSDYKYAGFYK